MRGDACFLVRPAIGVPLREGMIEVAKKLATVAREREGFLEHTQPVILGEHAVAMQHTAL